jgi:site-specific recombinase XerD
VTTLPAARPAPAVLAADDRLTRLTAAWLLSAGSSHTRRAYRTDLAQWAAWLDDHDIPLMAPARGHVDAFSAELGALGAAPATIARKVAAVSSFYRYAADEDIIPANPAARARRPAIDPDYSPTHGLDIGEARALITAADTDSPRSSAIIRELLETGMRVSELAAQQIQDLGAERGHRYTTITRKGGRKQKLPLPPTAAHAVDAVTAGRTAGPVIATRTGQPMAPSEIYRTVRRLARRAGITKKITPHSLRHAYATLALDAGVPLRDVQTDLGHRDPRTTRRYDRARERLDRSGAYRVAAVLGI